MSFHPNRAADPNRNPAKHATGYSEASGEKGYVEGNTVEKYDMRPEIKNKEFAQGTLFKAHPSLIPDSERYPRGYTPGRMDEVKSVVGEVVDAAPRWEPEVGESPNPEFPQRRAHLLESLARSRASAEDIATPKSWMLADDTDGSRPNGYFMPGHQGNPGLIALFKDKTPTADPAKLGREATSTAIHELGHAVSHREEGPMWLGMQDPIGMGREEGKADAYGDANATLPGRKGKAAISKSRPSNWYGAYNIQSSQDQADFSENYYAQRYAKERAENALSAEQFKRAGSPTQRELITVNDWDDDNTLKYEHYEDDTDEKFGDVIDLGSTPKPKNYEAY